jgi:hypothetical protein
VTINTRIALSSIKQYQSPKSYAASGSGGSTRDGSGRNDNGSVHDNVHDNVRNACSIGLLMHGGLNEGDQNRTATLLQRLLQY